MKGYSDNVTFAKFDHYYISKLGHNRVIKINNETVYRELNGEIIKDNRYKFPEQFTSYFDNVDSMEFSEIKKDKKIITIAKNIYSNKKIRKLVKIFGSLILIYALYTTAPAAGLAYAIDETISTATEIDQVRTFINYIINLIRVIAGIICSLIAANAGLKILTEENTDSIKEAKKVANKILWALFLIFVGTSIANLITRKLLTGI